MRALLTLGLLLVPQLAAAEDWSAYGGDAGGTRFSELTQIAPDNVGSLEIAWQTRTGDMDLRPDEAMFGALHATPILLPEDAGQSLVLCSAFNRILALDPPTGEERWVFDHAVSQTQPEGKRYNCRGLSYWRDPDAAEGAACVHRIFSGTNDRRLIAVDAVTGEPCAGFGENGMVDVNPMVAESIPEAAVSELQFVSPPTVVGDVVVLGSTNNAKFKKAFAPAGTIRAFDARTGAVRWTFETVPQDPDDPAYAAWSEAGRAATGGANAWSMMSVDEERDLIFIPTASAAPDFFGGERPGDNRYANSLLAIRGATGELVWHFQIVHHDVWDYDLPAQPILTEIERDGERVPVVVQLTKQSLVFVFDRETGEPFFDVVERAVPTDGYPGDPLSPTQPFPVRPPPLSPVGITEQDGWGMTLADKRACQRLIREARHGRMYTPPTEQGTVIFPGPSGGSNWGGGAVDPTRNLLVTNVSRLPFFVRIIPRDKVPPESEGNFMAGMAFGPPGPLAGTDVALEQRPLMAPSFTPCTEPPWATQVAVDLK